MGRRRVTKSSGEDEAERSSTNPKCLTEEETLQPVSKDVHPDNWPCFVLNGAVVYGKDGRTPANLLHAELEGPFTVRGKLEVDKEFRHLLKNPSRKVQEVEVTDVRGFSIGLGPITIWASGRAGWFEIRPGPAYRKVFDKMSEGVTLYYFLIDLYESKKALQLDRIFHEYSKAFDKSLTPAQVAQRCEEHATFLISQMRKPGEPRRWTHTTFYRWLVDQCCYIYDRYRAKGSAPEPLSPISPTGGIQVPGMKKQRSTTLSETPLPSRTRSRNSSLSVILMIMENLHNSGRLPRKRMSIHWLAKFMYEDYDIMDEPMARVILEAHAEYIFLALDAKWSDSPIYKELEQILSEPEEETNMQEMAREIILKPRILEGQNQGHSQSHTSHLGQAPNRAKVGSRKRSLQSEGDNDSTLPEDELEREPRTQQRRIERKPKRRQSSTDENLLRTARLGKARAPTSPSEASHTMTTRSRSSSDEDQSRKIPISLSGRRRGPSRSGKVAALRLIGSSPAMERLGPSLSDDEDEEGPSRKRSRPISLVSSDDSETTYSGSDLTPYLEAGGFDEEVEETDAMEGLTLISEPILSASPQGPNGLWSCQREGCSYKVAGADKSDGRSKVRAHFLQHADEIAEREALVMAESKPYLPTSHLLEMLRKLGESARLAEERKIGGRTVPEPIKRQLAI